MSGALHLPPHFLTAVSLHDGGYFETGGWLLSRRDSPDQVVVATGPGHAATRARDSIAIARTGVDAAAAAVGLVVAGCWHSHPPSRHGIEPSPADRTAWQDELARSPQDLDAWRGVIVLRAQRRTEALGAWVTRRSGACEPIPLPPITEQARTLARSLTFGIARGPLVEPLSKWQPAAIRRELARIEVELEAEELVRLADTNKRLKRLGIKTELRPVAKPKPREVVVHRAPTPPPAARRNLDLALQDWLAAAPPELDDAIWERFVTLAQTAVGGGSILDHVYSQHLAGMR